MDELFTQALAAGELAARSDARSSPSRRRRSRTKWRQHAGRKRRRDAYPGADRGQRRQRLQFRDGASADACRGSTRSSPQSINPSGDQLLLVNYRGDGAALAAALSARGWTAIRRHGRPHVARGPGRRRRSRLPPPALAAPAPAARCASRAGSRNEGRRRPDRAAARLAAERRDDRASSCPTPTARRSIISATGACGRSRRPS